ncbi:MAG: DNA photolyase family protein [Betaproteobacteria bacterium]|uniref:cryptochrome/photolyase family protein n=1 Tax=Serpentinimonas maccroryi TaxID=1458426 RepID=UPI002033D47D|nr:deoxyribodipyrimidine photo-lyase [Serpentinimonas maccroryi]MCL5968211.1 DNA photolyase family protein [Betaproteobacteria bacterium]MCM2479928.1 deoxyribodipyrimidine photo-lyase [Serpentinimonas maccroryi]
MTLAPKTYPSGLVWLRRDLRSHDHAALHQALRQCQRVWCVFVFDTDILQPLLERGLQADRRVEFIHESLIDLDEQLRALGRSNGTEGVGLLVCHGRAIEQIPRLAAQLGVQAVYANHDHEPAALARDAQVRGALAHEGVLLHTYKDQVVFERHEILNQSGHAFTVFTPYKKAWLQSLTPSHTQPHPVERFADALAPFPPGLATGVPPLEALGFVPSNLRELKIRTGSRGALALLEDFLARIEHYGQTRDFPALKGPSYLSVHLRFGTLSIRQAVRLAHDLHQQGVAGASTWLSELIWREFYQQILAHFPHVAERAFKPVYDRIRWEHGKTAQAHFAAWCAGQTGYPLVDAAMHQLNQSGYMHNRLRMVAASFLCKDLGLDWRWGERYFADHLIDFDLAANNGGWQWCASSGCDAQPYFRIFNPVLQSEKFDPQGKFIRRYLPPLASLPDAQLHAPWRASAHDLAAAGVVLGRNYPAPLVDHFEARALTLERYAVARTET